MSATSGLTSRVSASISPAWFMPISNTPYSASRGKRASDSGTPHWLLRLPRDAVVGPWRSSAWRSISLVPVLPTLPVTPMTMAWLRARAARPRSSSARCVSATVSSGAPAGSCFALRLTTAADAPLPNASATKSWPSALGPLIATNRSPRAKRAAVDRDAHGAPIAAVAAGGRGRSFGGGPERAHAPPPARSAMAARASSLSEKGRVLGPTIWPLSWPLPAISSRSPCAQRCDARRGWPRGGRRSRAPWGRRPGWRGGSPPGLRCGGCRR